VIFRLGKIQWRFHAADTPLRRLARCLPEYTAGFWNYGKPIKIFLRVLNTMPAAFVLIGCVDRKSRLF
jgi:hypothetical protein